MTVACRAGLPVRLVEPESSSGELGGEGEGGAVGDLEVLGGGGDGAFGAEDFGLDFEGVAVGRVEGEVRAVEVDEDLAEAEGDALEDLGQRGADGGDLGGFGVDVEAFADDDVAEVIAAGDGGGDEDEAERGALVGAGEVDLAGEVEGVGAGAGAGGEFADVGWRRGSWGWPARRGRCGFRGRRRRSRPRGSRRRP